MLPRNILGTIFHQKRSVLRAIFNAFFISLTRAHGVNPRGQFSHFVNFYIFPIRAPLNHLQQRLPSREKTVEGLVSQVHYLSMSAEVHLDGRGQRFSRDRSGGYHFSSLEDIISINITLLRTGHRLRGMIVSLLFLLRPIASSDTNVRCYNIVTSTGSLTGVRRTRANRFTDRVRNSLAEGDRIFNS